MQYANNLIKFIGLYPEGQFPTTANLDTISWLLDGTNKPDKETAKDGLKSSILNSIKGLSLNVNNANIDNPEILNNLMNQFCIDLLNDRMAETQYSIDLLYNTLNAISKPDKLTSNYTNQLSNTF